MKTIKTYSTTVEADLARLALETAGIPSTVVGISSGMEGGVAGVQLLMPDDRVEAALTLLKDAGSLRLSYQVAACQPLAHQRHQNYREREEKNQIMIGKWLAVARSEWNGKRRGERHHAAHARGSEHEWPLPR